MRWGVQRAGVRRPHRRGLLRVTRDAKAYADTTSRGLRTVRTGYAYQPPACLTCRRFRAACPGVRLLYVRRTRTSLGRAVRTYRGTPGGSRLTRRSSGSTMQAAAGAVSRWRRRRGRSGRRRRRCCMIASEIRKG
eukprot:scaffold32300_cov69-Phaeocystis_antarctica.AAC.1